LEKVQVHPTGLVDPKEPDAKVKFLAAEALRGVGGLLLDNEGDRFADELGRRDYVSQRMWDQNKFPVRLILNGEATKEIEWHCKHYVGRGLMKKFENGDEVAKEMGISPKKLADTFEKYSAVVKNPKTDPFGKKFFSNTTWNMNAGPFHVAQMTPVLHYTMGGLEIDEHSQVRDKSGKPIPGLFASGEVAGGVHGANRLGGSSLLGCVVFGRVAGDSAASYLLKEISEKPAQRLGQVGGHLGMATTVRINPETKKVNLEFSWDDSANASASSSSSSSQAFDSANPTPTKPTAIEAKSEKAEKKGEDKVLKKYTLEDVAKHTSKEDCWVVVNGQVMSVTDFLPDHPGGVKAIMIHAGKDCTEEFEMMHAPGTIEKYAKHTIIGTLSS